MGTMSCIHTCIYLEMFYHTDEYYLIHKVWKLTKKNIIKSETFKLKCKSKQWDILGGPYKSSSQTPDVNPGRNGLKLKAPFRPGGWLARRLCIHLSSHWRRRLLESPPLGLKWMRSRAKKYTLGVDEG